MGVGPAIFQTVGQRSEHYVPGAYSRSAAIGGAGSGVSANNSVVLGRARGGQSNRLFVFSTLFEAKETLVDGELLRAVAHAFNPSPEYSPQAVRAMVVNGNTQGESVMRKGEQEILNVKTASYGVIANSISRQLQEGSNPGTWKMTFTAGESEEVIDNIGKRSIQIQYTGSSAEASLTINNTGLTVQKTDGSIVVNFEDFPTVEEVAARLIATDEFAVVLLDTESNVPSTELDHVSSIDIASKEVVLTSDFYALVRAMERNPWIGSGNVTKADNAGNFMPDNDDQPVFFRDASAGTFTIDDWAKTLSALETENIQMIATHVTDAAVHTLISNHCTAMSNVQNRKERTALLGGPIDQTIEEACEIAGNLNNKLVSYCYPAIRAASPLTGEAENLPASYFACKLLGMESTVAVNEPLTWKNVSVLQFLNKLKISEMEKLIQGGVLCGGATDDNRLAVIRAMTTHQGAQLQLVERSMVREDLYMNRDLRVRYSVGVGRPGIGKSGDVESTLYNAARSWRGEGLIVPNDSGQNVWGVVVRVSGDKTYISFSRNLTAPQNFFFITAFNYVYESATTVEV